MMLCPKCYSNNPETSRFCVQCGTAIADRYIKCGFDNIPEARLCGRCVAPDRIFKIDDSSKTDSSRSEKQLGAGIRDDERRHLTFLFSDPVGSITLAAQVDSEEWREPIATGDLKALLDELSISGGGEH
jgi:double zinc ribbon protein